MAAGASPTGHGLQVVRVYDGPKRSRGDGRRVIVDRLWPRGVSKDSLDFDEWNKAVAPSGELRKWYGHDVDKFEEFVARYRRELHDGDAAGAFAGLLDTWRAQPLTLLTATKDVEHSGATVLADTLRAAAG
jgi:uncharacterized protein YeaO (DUF488 family)